MVLIVGDYLMSEDTSRQDMIPEFLFLKFC